MTERQHACCTRWHEVFQQRESATSAAAAAEQARDLSCAAVAFAAFETFNFNRETQFGHLRHDVVEQGQESKGRSIALLPHGSIQDSYSKERPGVVRVQERNGGDLNALKDQNNKAACLVSHAVANRTICKGLQTSCLLSYAPFRNRGYIPP